MTITLQDVEVIMGLPIKGEAMVGPTKRTWTDVYAEMLGIQIPNDDQTVLKGQRILIPHLSKELNNHCLRMPMRFKFISTLAAIY